MDKNLKSLLVKAGILAAIVTAGVYSDGLMYLLLSVYWMVALYLLITPEATLKKTADPLRTTYFVPHIVMSVANIAALAWFGHWITGFVAFVAFLKSFAISKSVTDESNG